MELKEQVASLELSKKLKELGVEQESLWWWEHHIFGGSEHRRPDSIILRLEKDTKTTDGKRVEFKDDIYSKNYYSAFTVAELGKRLPKEITMGEGRIFHFNQNYGWGEWIVYYRNNLEIRANTEANARAKMLCYLIENNLLEKK